MINSLSLKKREMFQVTAETNATVVREKNADKDIIYVSVPYMAVYGTGERFNGMNQKGNHLVCKVEEKFCCQGDVSYCVTPFFVTDSGLGIYIHTEEVTEFFFEDVIKCIIPKDAEVTVFTGTIKEIIADYIRMLGRFSTPPKYAFGPWISAHHWNSQHRVEQQLKIIEKYKFPVSVIVLEAWSDEATFYIFNGAKYTPAPNGEALSYENFDFSESLYWQDPKKMIADLHQKGIHLVLWQIPVFKLQDISEENNQQNDLDRENAVKKNLCVMNKDGTPYSIPKGKWFAGSFVPDFTKKETLQEWFGKRKYLIDIGVDGFKTDGGEFIYDENAVFADGKSGKEGINQYSQDYLNAYTHFINEEQVLFSRAGYAGSHITPIHWAGDHQSTNEEFRAVLSAGLSAAMSGMVFWGFDIGGFAGPLPSIDLYRRATQCACFSPVMQWHSEPEGGQFKDIMPGNEGNNERSPWNLAQFYGEPEFLEEIKYWHWLRMNLIPYIYNIALESEKKLCPMMRPLVYEWQNDHEVALIEDEYMFGESLLIAPLIEENRTSRKLYLPEGDWYGFFTKEKYTGKQYIFSKEKFPVYIRGGKCVPLNVQNSENIGEEIELYDEHIHLLLAGQEGEIVLRDKGKNRYVKWKQDEVIIDNSCERKEAENITWEIL